MDAILKEQMGMPSFSYYELRPPVETKKLSFLKKKK